MSGRVDTRRFILVCAAVALFACAKGKLAEPDGGGTGGGGGRGGGGGTGATSCTLAGECPLGLCIDGFCCDTACRGACEACNVAGREGLCSTVPDGKDPNEECEGADYVCGGVCDGQGACRFPAPTKACGPTTCSAGSAAGMLCSGAGHCTASPATTCDPYLCADGEICKTSCGSPADCVPGSACEGGVCKPQKPSGTPCVLAGDCDSGLCVDGVCCGSACTEACRSCAVVGMAGTCASVTAAEDADTCASASVCDAAGVCKKKDGQPCDAAKADECASNTCVDGICCAKACGACQRCDMTPGTCTDVPAGMDPKSECGAYACDGQGACASACSGGSCSAACKPGNYCEGTACVPKKTGAMAACTADCECASGSCGGGICCATDCQGPCRTCATGTCAPIAANTDPKMGCTAGFTCDGAGACRTACTADVMCQSGLYCTANAAGACLSKKSAAATCAGDSIDTKGDHQCTSAFCADGFCCGTPCAGPCESCAIGGKEGTCAPQAANTDPDKECAGGLTCSGAAACRTTCDGDGTCETAYYCDKLAAGACQAKKMDGLTCGADPVDATGNHQCLANSCAGGTCAASIPCGDAMGKPVDTSCPAGQYCRASTLKCAACVTGMTDDDGDGSPSKRCGGADCNDHDAAVHPGAADPVDVTVDVNEALASVVQPVSARFQKAAAFDPAGRLGVTFYTKAILASDRFVKFMKQTGTGGFSAAENAVVDINLWGAVALAFDASNGAWVLYRSNTKFFSVRGTSFWTTPLPVASSGGFWSRLGISADGTLRALDLEGNAGTNAVRYFERTTAWGAPEVIDATAVSDGGSIGFVVETDGTVHVSFADAESRSLVHAVRAPAGGWTTETVASPLPGQTAGVFSALAVDAARGVHVAFVSADAGAGIERLVYATKSFSGAWTTVDLVPDLGSVGAYPAIAVDGRGVHIAYSKGAPEYDLVYTTSLTGDWSSFTVDAEAAFGSYEPDLLVASDGKVHLVHHSDATKILRHAVLSVGNTSDDNCDGR